MLRLRPLAALVVAAAITCAAIFAPTAGAANYRPVQKTNCWYSSALCTEIADPQDFWGSWYVGHDEPSLLFYSNVAGSGNQMTYRMKLPKDPSGSYSSSKSYNFELHPAFWFGMAMCDTQSYPEQLKTCTPDSDSNARDVRTTTKLPGSAFMELQFYAPGWIQQFAGSSCAAQKWCIALNIDSLSEDPIAGTTLNSTCQSKILGGLEYVNFAYLTSSGTPQGPPNPLQFDPVASGRPGSTVLYMNSGDTVTVNLHDSSSGLVTTVTDDTTHQTGSMVASAANGFGQIKYAPHGSGCTEIPYNFHPEYSTASPQTRVPWAAHSYNIAFSDEIGHFDYCTHINPDSPTSSCDGLEGNVGDQEAADGDDNFCFSSAQSLFYPVTGCEDSNDPGFDGTSYQNDWPDGNTTNHPTPVLFSSPVTVGGVSYSQAAFETDMPRLEASDFGGSCDRSTGVGCTNPPPTDDGQPATFYPYFSTVTGGPGGSCSWGLGSTLPGTINNYGGNSTAEYGPIFGQYYYVFGGHGATHLVYNDYQQRVANSC